MPVLVVNYSVFWIKDFVLCVKVCVLGVNTVHFRGKKQVFRGKDYDLGIKDFIYV